MLLNLHSHIAVLFVSTRGCYLLSDMAMQDLDQHGEAQWPHFITAVDAVRGLHIRGPSQKPRVEDRRAVPRTIEIADLPLVPAGDTANQIVSFCDVIRDVTGPLEAPILFGLCEKGKLGRSSPSTRTQGSTESSLHHADLHRSGRPAASQPGEAERVCWVVPCGEALHRVRRQDASRPASSALLWNSNEG